MEKVINILKYFFSSNKKEKKCDLAENKEKTFHPEVEKYRPTIEVLCYSLQIYHSLNEITKCIETLNKYPDVADKIVSDIKERLEEIVNKEKGANGDEREIPFSKQKPTGKVEPIEWSGKIKSRKAKGVLKEMLDKKLKPAYKVEPKFKVGDKIRKKTPSSFDRDMQVARIEKDYYVCNHIGKFSSEVVLFSKESSYELIEQKPTWSEENKRKMDRIYSILRQAADTHAFSTSCRLIGDKEAIELQEFLKGIKNGNLSQSTQEATDILIDKIYAWLKQNVNKYLYNTGDNDVYIPSCSGKMIEDLKNYIKEESK